MALANKRGRKPKKMVEDSNTNETTRLLAEGGMMDDGGQVEPTSGNDVPVGSLSNEVKDDVPAMLSEGEFVLPADVVRYIGLERLMKMRDEAKAGLQRMEEIGQMGNAEQAPMSDESFQQDDDKFESEIDDIISEDEQRVGFAEGGVVTGSAYVNPIGNPVVDVRQYKHTDGRVIYITFFNNKPSTPIPEGFTVVSKSAEQQITTTPATPTTGAAVSTTSGGGSGGSSNYGMEPSAWDSMTDTEKAAWYAENPTFAKITQTLQNLWGYTAIGKIQEKLNPDFVERQKLIAQGVDPVTFLQGGNISQLTSNLPAGVMTVSDKYGNVYTKVTPESIKAADDAFIREVEAENARQSAQSSLMDSLQSSAAGREAAATGMVTTPSGTIVSSDKTIAAQDAANFGVVSTGGGYGSSAEAAQTGMTTVGGVSYSNDATIAAQDAATFGTDSVSDGGGRSGGSSKIVCTAMNHAYGFGSFRNAIWLAYAQKNLTKEHEKGYHAIFLPLVDYAYKQGDGITHRVLRRVLENIARHRSADLRAEMRGLKRDAVGRVYRAVLEPMCYIVGKLKK